MGRDGRKGTKGRHPACLGFKSLCGLRWDDGNQTARDGTEIL
jgi:hypothetical protein